MYQFSKWYAAQMQVSIVSCDIVHWFSAEATTNIADMSFSGSCVKSPRSLIKNDAKDPSS